MCQQQSPPPFNCVLVWVGDHVPHSKLNILICKYTCNSIEVGELVYMTPFVLLNHESINKCFATLQYQHNIAPLKFLLKPSLIAHPSLPSFLAAYLLPTTLVLARHHASSYRIGSCRVRVERATSWNACSNNYTNSVLLLLPFCTEATT